MVNRSYFAPDFEFDDNVRAELLALIPGKDRSKAKQYLKLIENRLTLFIPERANIAATPIPRHKAIRKSLDDIASLALQLGAKLDDLDPIGEQPKLELALFRMQESINFHAQCSKSLHTLCTAATIAKSFVPADAGGAPSRDHDVGFIADIALVYKQLYKKLPAAGRNSWFTIFVSALFPAISEVPGLLATDNYRLVNKALDRIRGQKATPLP